MIVTVVIFFSSAVKLQFPHNDIEIMCQRQLPSPGVILGMKVVLKHFGREKKTSLSNSLNETSLGKADTMAWLKAANSIKCEFKKLLFRTAFEVNSFLKFIKSSSSKISYQISECYLKKIN